MAESVGKYTYGGYRIHNGGTCANVIIGNFCSIGANLQLWTGNNHRTDWVSTYPFGHIHKDIFDNYNGEETIGDYLKNNEHEIIKIESDKSYAINDMIFGGWVRGKVETGMLLTIKEDDLTGEYSYDYINDVKVDLSINLIPKIEFAEGFVHFYDSVFANVHENYEAYLKSTLKENDSLDNDIEEYIENNNLTISVEEFKADDKLVSDLAEDLASEAKDWDDYYSMLEDEFKN